MVCQKATLQEKRFPPTFFFGSSTIKQTKSSHHLRGGVGAAREDAHTRDFEDPRGLLQHTANGAAALLVDHGRGMGHGRAPGARLEHRVVDGVGGKALFRAEERGSKTG